MLSLGSIGISKTISKKLNLPSIDGWHYQMYLLSFSHGYTTIGVVMSGAHKLKHVCLIPCADSTKKPFDATILDSPITTCADSFTSANTVCKLVASKSADSLDIVLGYNCSEAVQVIGFKRKSKLHFPAKSTAVESTASTQPSTTAVQITSSPTPVPTSVPSNASYNHKRLSNDHLKALSNSVKKPRLPRSTLGTVIMNGKPLAPRVGNKMAHGWLRFYGQHICRIEKRNKTGSNAGTFHRFRVVNDKNDWKSVRTIKECLELVEKQLNRNFLNDMHNCKDPSIYALDENDAQVTPVDSGDESDDILGMKANTELPNPTTKVTGRVKEDQEEDQEEDQDTMDQKKDEADDEEDEDDDDEEDEDEEEDEEEEELESTGEYEDDDDQ